MNSPYGGPLGEPDGAWLMNSPYGGPLGEPDGAELPASPNGDGAGLPVSPNGDGARGGSPNGGGGAAGPPELGKSAGGATRALAEARAVARAGDCGATPWAGSVPAPKWSPWPCGYAGRPNPPEAGRSSNGDSSAASSSASGSAGRP